MDSYFDDLRLGVLEQFAQQWVNDFKDVQIISIELRHFSTPRRLSGRGGQATILYAIVFRTLEERAVAAEARNLLRVTEIEAGEIGMLPYFSSDGWQHVFLRDTSFNLEQSYHELQVRGVVPIAPFERLVCATKYMQTVPPRRYLDLFGNDFKKNYKIGAYPGDDFLKQWTFIPLAKGEDLPLSVKNNFPPVILYSKNATIDRNKLAIDVVVESERTFDIYRLLKKEDKLSHDQWAERINRLDFTYVIPPDLEGIRLHRNLGNLKRDITSDVAINVFNRIIPENYFTKRDVYKLIKENRTKKNRDQS